MPDQNDRANLSPVELETMLSRAAQKGAKLALKDVGLDGPDAEKDIQELRSLMCALNLAKRTALQTFIRITTVGVFAAMIAGISFKLKIFGEG